MNELALFGKYLGAGIACLALLGAALGLGNLFSSYFTAAMRNPSAADQQRTNLFIGFALIEATGIFGFLIALILIFS